MNDPYSISRVIARPLSVGLYSYEGQPRGSVVHCAAVADALHALGHGVTLYVLGKPSQEPLFRTTRARLVCIPTADGAGNLERAVGQQLLAVQSFLERSSAQHDVHHAQDWLMGSALASARSKLQAPVVRTVHHLERFDSPYLEHSQAHSIRGADLVLSVSEATQSELTARYRVASTRIESGIDNSFFAMPPARDVVELGARLGLSSAGPVLISYGGIEPRKNSLGVLQAFLMLRKRLPSACWVIVGGCRAFEAPAYRQEFERVLSACSPEDRASVIEAGVLSEREQLASYQLADAVICASHKEGFGMAALEALAAGVPVIASRIAPFTEHLDERCAVLVDPDDHAELSATMWRVLLRGRSDYARLSQGVERAKRFSWSRSAGDHARLYRELRERKASRFGEPVTKRARALG